MAIIKTGAIVTDIRGKLGGNVFSRNRGGAYVRQFVKPTNPQTAGQQTNRALFGTLMTEWRGLTTEQQTSWIQNAPMFPSKNKLGDTVILSGTQLFVKANIVLKSAGLPTMTNLPPAPAALLKAFTTEVYATNNPFTYDSVVPTPLLARIGITLPEGKVSPDDQYIQVFASNMVSSGINATSSVRKKLIGTYLVSSLVQVGSTDVYTVDVAADLSTAYGLTGPVYSERLKPRVVFTIRMFSGDDGVAIPVGANIYEVEDLAI